MEAREPEVGDLRVWADGAWQWDSWLAPDGRPVWIDEDVERVTGHPCADCLRMPDYPLPLVDERDREPLRRAREAALRVGRGVDLPVRIRRQDGGVAWVGMSWRVVRAGDGHRDGVHLSVRDLSDDGIGSLQGRYSAALSRLTRSGVLTSGDLRASLRAITETAAEALEVQRAGLWVMDASRSTITCRDLYEPREHCHSDGQCVERDLCPGYFAALDEARVIAAEYARRDPSTAELTAHYLDPLGIRAMLDVPIVRGGCTVGVLCHEEVGTPRRWSPCEISFANALADLASVALEAAECRELEALHRQLASILEATPDFVCMATADGRPVYVNAAGRSLLGLNCDGAPPDWGIAEIYPAWAREQRERVAVPTALREGVWSGESAFRLRDGETFPVSQVLIAHRDATGRPQFLSTLARDLRPWKAAQRQLEELNRDLEARVAERTARLEETNRHLESFAYSVSHDLKAPLRAINGYSRSLQEDFAADLPQAARDSLDHIRAAVGRMDRLIDGLLAYSRLERRELSRVRVRLPALVERVLAERDLDLKVSGVETRLDLGDLSVTADVEALEQALRNLLDNALKFSQAARPPQIGIAAEMQGDRVVVSVSDNGCGFDMRFHDRIFDVFHRLHQGDIYPGTGVGLGIVRTAAERMGGRVWAQSEPGFGATFYLELPA